MEDGARSTVEALYRGEMQRANTWRQRLDTSTNWAIVITAAVLTWVFSSPSNSHVALLLTEGLILVFSVLEARRYRLFDIWRTRVRLLEENVMAPAVHFKESEKNVDWSHVLADDLKDPRFKISMQEAWSRRMERVYIWIVSFLLIAWYSKLALDAPSALPGGLFEAAAVGGLGGTAIIAGVTLGYLVLIGLMLYEGSGEREAKGEIKPRQDERDWHDI